MIIIGVTGATGAGKSTFSGFLKESLNSAKVVPLDHIFDHLKNTLFSSNTSSFIRDNGEEICYLKKESSFSKLINLKGFKEVYQIIRRYYGSYVVNKEIRQAEKENVKYLILESINLYRFIDLEKVDYKILITSSDAIRRSRVMKRDSNLGQLLEDNFDSNDCFEVLKDCHDYIIENIGAIETLGINANNVANAIKENFSLIRKK